MQKLTCAVINAGYHEEDAEKNVLNIDTFYAKPCESVYTGNEWLYLILSVSFHT